MLVSRTRAYLILVLLLAALLRLAFLSREGFWFDEFYTVKQSAMSVPALLTDLAHSDVHPPLHHLLLLVIHRFFGVSEFLFRLPSVIFGVLSVLLAYSLGRLLFNRQAGLLAALLLAVNPFAINYSQEARAYSLLLFLSGAAALAWWSCVRSKDSEDSGGWSTRNILLYILASILLAYAHVYGLIFAGYLAVSFWALPRVQRRLWPEEESSLSSKRPFLAWLVVHLAILAGFAPWIPSLVLQVTRVQKAFWIPAPSSSFLLTYARDYLGHPLVVLVLLLMSLFTVARMQQLRGPERTAVAFLLGWIIYLLAVPYLLSQVGQPIMIPKYSISVLFPLVLLSARGLLLLNNSGLRKALVVLVLSLSLWWLFPTLYLTPNREQWKEMASSVQAQYDPERDIVAYYDPSDNQRFCYTYYLPPGIATVGISGTGEKCQQSLERFRAVVQESGAHRAWIMKMRVRQEIPDELLEEWAVSGRESFRGGELVRLERRSPGSE
jgi:mannosyltransferase